MSADREVRADEALLDQIGPAFARLRRRTTSPRSDLTRNLLLNLAHERPGDLTVGELAIELGIAQPVASRAVAAAVADGLVRRRAAQSDGRRVIVELTDAGDAEREFNARQQREGFELITAHWSPADRDQFARFLIRYSQDGADWSARQWQHRAQ